MEIFFRTKKLQELCSSGREMQKHHGRALADKLKQRLTELSAAKTLADISRLPPPRCHEHKGNRKGQFTVDLTNQMRLVFIPANEPIPRRDDGGIDLARVTQIEIITIEDPHPNK